VWACDEHRIGLKPILRRVWALKGQQPVLIVQPRYEWSYLHGFVRPGSGDSFWFLTPGINIELFELALREFAKARGAGGNKVIFLVLDRAGWHASSKVVVPEGVRLLFLPPYSPELQPAERLWSLSNETICNRCFATIEELEEAQIQRCQQLLQQPHIIRARTLFHWWPNDY
jgi:transposase